MAHSPLGKWFKYFLIFIGILSPIILYNNGDFMGILILLVFGSIAIVLSNLAFNHFLKSSIEKKKKLNRSSHSNAKLKKNNLSNSKVTSCLKAIICVGLVLAGLVFVIELFANADAGDETIILGVVFCSSIVAMLFLLWSFLKNEMSKDD